MKTTRSKQFLRRLTKWREPWIWPPMPNIPKDFWKAREQLIRSIDAMSGADFAIVSQAKEKENAN